MYTIEGGITAAKGFKASSCAAGIKYEGRTDMAMIWSDAPCTTAGVYTSNLVKAACVQWDKAVTASDEKVSTVVINAGIANACTGELGLQYCEETAKAVSEEKGIPVKGTLVASTGVIGKQLPIEKIVNGAVVLCETLDGSKEAGTLASKAIMTTDTVNKEVAVSFQISGKTVTMGGMCKGAGMIHPNMCTMLGFITTDCAIDKKLLQKALSENVTDTFNMVSVDGDTSTNDTLVVLANGLAENPIVDKEGADYETFKAALFEVMKTLAKKMAADGEGATAMLEVNVVNAKTKEQARVLAKSVICSSLTKAAIYGHDANWGRILCAFGYSGETFDPENVTLSFEGGGESILIFENGVGTDFSEEKATKILSNKEVKVIADFHMGDASATAWGCDLTHEYVSINADYRS
ncbi:MAG: bifunctional glutamate N-acetyltransferase/amino-acid acetyltransferase ArgJ [Lachnospiraceae bacterium]|nr:bifunctional glutamate N-acetyltransferase/amino-acid acetyltransferase ArgJ [Lachnospiraceae bacterium]